MKYESKKEQISKFIEDNVIPAVKRKDLDYDKVIKGIADQFGTTEDIVNNIIKRFVSLGKLAECHVLTIRDDEIKDWLVELEREQKEKKEDEKKSLQFLDELKKNAIKKNE